MTYSPAELEQIDRYLRDPRLPPDFETWITEWVGGHLLSLPASSLLGAASFIYRVASQVDASETTASTTFVDLSTVGPELTQLANGRWLVFWGAKFENMSTDAHGYMGMSVNGSTPSDSQVAHNHEDVDGIQALMYARHFGIGGAPALTADHNNTLTAKYKASGGTARFEDRWMVALRTGDV